MAVLVASRQNNVSPDNTRKAGAMYSDFMDAKLSAECQPQL
jgi:hypothetical protein